MLEGTHSPTAVIAKGEWRSDFVRFSASPACVVSCPKFSATQQPMYRYSVHSGQVKAPCLASQSTHGRRLCAIVLCVVISMLSPFPCLRSYCKPRTTVRRQANNTISQDVPAWAAQGMKKRKRRRISRKVPLSPTSDIPVTALSGLCDLSTEDVVQV
jgi:hypothetical protein